jgi:hypothetical protein
MRNNKVTVTKEIYLLVRELERLEEVLDFTVFYSFSRILESHNFCPAFDFEGEYYEIQYDNSDELHVLNFGARGYKEEGDILTKKEIEELTENLKKLEKKPKNI